MREDNNLKAEPVEKAGYLSELRRRLAALPEDEREAALTYYGEYFDDAGPEEVERVLSELGPVHTLAEQILSGYSRDYLDAVPRSSSTQVPARPEDAAESRRREQAQLEEEAREQAKREEAARAKAKGKNRERSEGAAPPRRSGASVLLIIILVILALPLLLPLVIGIFAVGLGLAVAAFGVAVAMGAAVLALLAAGVVLLVAGFGLIITHTLEAFIACGIGLSLLGVGILLTVLCVFLFVKLAPALIRLTVRIIRWPFERRAVRA